MSELIKNKREQYRVHLDSCVVDAMRAISQSGRLNRGIDSQLVNLLIWLGIVQLREIANFKNHINKRRKPRKLAINNIDCDEDEDEDED